MNKSSILGLVLSSFLGFSMVACVGATPEESEEQGPAETSARAEPAADVKGAEGAYDRTVKGFSAASPGASVATRVKKEYGVDSAAEGLAGAVAGDGEGAEQDYQHVNCGVGSTCAANCWAGPADWFPVYYSGTTCTGAANAACIAKGRPQGAWGVCLGTLY